MSLKDREVIKINLF